MKAYLILDFAINDMERFAEYIQNIPAHISKHSGRYIVRGTVPTVMEGDWNPERVVVIEFPERTNTGQFLQDPEAESLFEIRHSATTSKLILVDGE